MNNPLLKESFAPTVLMKDHNGQDITVTPPGWVWIFAFAIKGVKWAEKEVLKPEFDKIVREWFDARKRLKIQEEIEVYEQEIRKLKERLK